MGKNKKRKWKQQQKRNEADEPPSSSTGYPLPSPPTPLTSVSELRNWAELPELALHSILTRILTSNPDPPPDFLSFSSVCRSWKSFSATSRTSFPPLLLLPDVSPGNPKHRPNWSRPPLCRLQTLLTGRTFQSKLPPGTLTLPFLGYSNGRLIFLSDRNTPLLADVFTGELTRIRPPPVDDFPRLCLALLADQDLFLLISKSLLLAYWPGTDSWSKLAIANPARDIVSLAFHRGKLFVLDSMPRLMVVDLGGGKDDIFIGGWKLMEATVPVEPPKEPPILCINFDRRLVECGGELLLLRLNVMLQLPRFRSRIMVYCLDFERSVWVWKESLGDWCIFLDTVGYCPVACPDPARWGGRSNCVYFKGLGSDNWAVVPLNEDIVSNDAAERLEHVLSPNLRRWPIPMWVYPNMLLSGTSNNPLAKRRN